MIYIWLLIFAVSEYIHNDGEGMHASAQRGAHAAAAGHQVTLCLLGRHGRGGNAHSRAQLHGLVVRPEDAVDPWKPQDPAVGIAGLMRLGGA